VSRIGINEFSIEINGLKGFFEGFRYRSGRVEVKGNDDSTVASIAIDRTKESTIRKTVRSRNNTEGIQGTGGGYWRRIRGLESIPVSLTRKGSGERGCRIR
jgi:hypothetical protein